MANRYNLNEPLTVQNQAKLIIKGVGGALLKTQFYNIDQKRVAREQADENTYGVTGNLLGSPVFDAVIFKKPNGDATLSSQNNGGQITSEDLVLPIALLTITQEKNIVRTAIQGRNGTIKEYVSDGDFSVNIKGVIVGVDSNKPPVTELKKLDSFCTSPLTLDVVCNVLDYFKIYTVVIMGYTYEQREGMRNVYDFNLNCVSDIPFEIKSNA
jgi:hypothetical protein